MAPRRIATRKKGNPPVVQARVRSMPTMTPYKVIDMDFS
jgi:hypothetical protein